MCPLSGRQSVHLPLNLLDISVLDPRCRSLEAWTIPLFMSRAMAGVNDTSSSCHCLPRLPRACPHFQCRAPCLRQTPPAAAGRSIQNHPSSLKPRAVIPKDWPRVTRHSSHWAQPTTVAKLPSNNHVPLKLARPGTCADNFVLAHLANRANPLSVQVVPYLAPGAMVPHRPARID